MTTAGIAAIVCILGLVLLLGSVTGWWSRTAAWVLYGAISLVALVFEWVRNMR